MNLSAVRQGAGRVTQVPVNVLYGLLARAAAAPSSVPTGRALARAGLLFFALRGALPGF